MNISLASKKALFTGGTHGIGKAIARDLVSLGCNIVIAARKEERQRVKEELRQQGSPAGGAQQPALKAPPLAAVPEAEPTVSCDEELTPRLQAPVGTSQRLIADEL